VTRIMPHAASISARLPAMRGGSDLYRTPIPVSLGRRAPVQGVSFSGHPWPCGGRWPPVSRWLRHIINRLVVTTSYER
jgi:hypothetical protein